MHHFHWNFHHIGHLHFWGLEVFYFYTNFHPQFLLICPRLCLLYQYCFSHKKKITSRYFLNIAFTQSIHSSGIVNGVHICLFNWIPIFSLQKYYPPWEFPVGINAIAPTVLCSPVLISCDSCVCTYYTTVGLQCFSSINYPVIIYLGIGSSNASAIFGNMFSQNMLAAMGLIVIRSGSFFNGIVVFTHINLSLIVIMYISMARTCSFRPYKSCLW